MINIIKYIWQLPQNLIGVIYKSLFATDSIHETEDYEVLAHNNKGCVTLGRYIFVSPYVNSTIIQHETGHVKQSLILGPFYLLVIGLPSLVHAAVHKKWCPSTLNYYHFYTEKWANKLANLES